MRMIIKIDMDNAAFDNSQGDEVARILGVVSRNIGLHKTIDETAYFPPLLDANGNRCGTIKVVKETT
jgi:hypothetical protein